MFPARHCAPLTPPLGFDQSLRPTDRAPDAAAAPRQPPSTGFLPQASVVNAAPDLLDYFGTQ